MAQQVVFSLPAASRVALEMFNAKGERVKSIFNGYRDNGCHGITLGLKSCAPGYYFFVLSAEGAGKVIAGAMLK